MYFYGSFLTQSGETVTVHIVTENSRTQQVEIGDEKSGVFFTTNPVEIESSVNDTFDHLLRSQATIRLLTRDFIKDLFCTSCMDAVVNIFKGNKCIFAGFVEPQTYSQGYNEVYDELEISCIDVLSALQYSKYRNIGGSGVVYEVVKANAKQRIFSEIIGDILKGVCASIDITGIGGVQYYYDGSKALTANANRYGIFAQLAISELLFLGKEEDDVWNQDTVLEEILKYLNLHIIQDGLQFYIFSWESIKSPEAVEWCSLTTGTNLTTHKKHVTFNLENVASTDTTISIGEVYNQILLTCAVENVEQLIESPLDADALVSPFSNRQKYMTEYSSTFEGHDRPDVLGAFYAITHDIPTNLPCGVITDWYMQVKNNPSWSFHDSRHTNLMETFCRADYNQQSLPNHLASLAGAALVSFGKVEHKTDHKDNSPVSKIDMTDYLVVSVNGNGVDDMQKAFPTEKSLLDASPCAVYRGPVTGAVFSPSDEDTTNYIVLSGKIALSPLVKLSAGYKDIRDKESPYLISFVDLCVPVQYRDGTRLYTQKYYKALTPKASPEWDEYRTHGLLPFTETSTQEYKFDYSSIGDGTDRISKVAVLACMLIIGDKCVVEVGSSGQISDFEWRPYKSREECADDDEYYQQCFTIGFDPKIGDMLIGTEYDLQNNIDYNIGIDAEGIAIPMRRSDNLRGEVQFMILGPVNTMWGEVTRRHRTWFRREKWDERAVPLLAHVSNIYIKSFEVKVYSDNGLINDVDDNNIIYISDTRETFVNRKDDIEFKINSALTANERRELGVSDSIKLSTPSNETTGFGIESVYDFKQGIQAKPEQLYVDSYYTEYHRPRIQMTQTVDDREDNVNQFSLYHHPAMENKQFYVVGISRNLIEANARLMLKEVWDD